MDNMQRELEALESTLNGLTDARSIPLSVLYHITNGFSNERIIGEGGCGVVYQGILLHRIVAVKKLTSTKVAINEKQFYQEVRSMLKIRHQNIVRLIGYCSNKAEEAMVFNGNLIFACKEERLLCFEYISNGSLDKHITDELRGCEWHTRFEIIKGVCEGLHHLHKEARINHMDLKPANILLDDDMVPKIADFGLARPDEVSRTLSADRLFSLGYCAPEYLLGGIISTQSDIYSLGVIINEVVTGSRKHPNITNVLRRWRHRWSKSVEHNPLLYKQVTTCMKLALKCQEEEPTRRPFIWDIVDALNKIESTTSSEFTYDQEISFLDDMLGIEPLELHFLFELRKNVSYPVQLTNDTNYHFAFSIKTTNPLLFRIEPDKGVIPARSKCSVLVILQPQEIEPNHRRSIYEFRVLSTRVDEVPTVLDSITEDLFTENMGKEVDKVNLTVVLDMEPLPEESIGKSSQAPTHFRGNNKVKVEMMARVKSLTVTKTCDEFAVLVRVTAPKGCKEHAGLDLVAVLDISGSMEGPRLNSMKMAMEFVINHLSQDDRLSIVSYNNEAHLLTELSAMSGLNQGTASAKVNQLTAGGGTNMSEALELADKILRQRGANEKRNRVGRIIFLSGGQDNNEILQQDISSEFPVETFGLGLDHDPEILRYIADKTFGVYSYVSKDLDKIKDAFAQSIGGLTSVTAMSLEINLNTHEGVCMRSIESGSYPSTMSSDKQSGTIHVHDLYAGEKKNFIVYLQVPQSKEQHLLTVSGSYRSPKINKEATILQLDAGQLIVLRTEDGETSAADSVCPEVAAELVRLQLAKDISAKLKDTTFYTPNELQILWEQIRGSEDGHTAPKSVMWRLGKDVDKMIKDANAISGPRHIGEGAAFILSWVSSHRWQRATTKGSPSNSGAFRTTTMEKMLEHVATPASFLQYVKKVLQV